MKTLLSHRHGRAGSRLIIFATLLAAFLVTNARGVTVTGFDPGTWPRTDAALGVTGFRIETFEDAALVPGLQVQLSGGTADYGPTGTLPRAFDPVADDPNADVLAPGIWDGSHVLLNRKTAPISYVDGEWADITFSVNGGASSIGFSVQQIEVPNTMMTVATSSGTTSFNLSNVANFSVGNGRNGYLRIDAGAGERILSVKIDNLSGDGFAIDHLAFLPAPVLRPVAHWKFDESSGPTALDSAGSFDGTLSATGAAFVSGGISGNAISLTRASGGYVNMGTTFPGFTSGDFTVSLWVKTTTTEADSLVLAKHEAFVSNGYLVAVSATGGGGATNKATFYASDSQVAQSPTSTTSINDDAWHHIVGVYRAGGTHSVYVDGSPAEASTASQAVVANAAPFLIGGVNVSGTPQARYAGLVDDVQVYDVALTDAQIDFLFTHPGQEFQPAIYDLATDWSDAMNPNCAWTYREGNNALPHVDWWQRATGEWTSAQPGWADSEDGNDRAPFWFKSNGAENFATDWLAGDIVVHTNNDPGTTGNGNANVIWTSPGTDTVTISGGVWDGEAIPARGNDWFLYKNATLLTQGRVEFGDAFSRANPFLFSAGSGGAAAVTNIAVVAGDVIKLEFVKTSSFGDIVGVNMTIVGATLAAAPSVTTQPASDIVNENGVVRAALHGEINPNETIVSAFFEFGTTAAYGSATPLVSIGCGTAAVPLETTINNLNPGQTYHYRLVALTSAGPIYGEDMTFIQLLPEPDVTTGTATDVRVHRAKLRGTLDPNDTDTSYFFEYGETTSYGSVTPAVDFGTTFGPVSATITGLDGATTYHFRLVGKRGATTFPGGDSMFTTLTPGTFKVAARGDFAPDAAGAATTATFFSFGQPAIGDAGHLAFRATLTKLTGGVLATNDTGIWAENNTGLRLIAREGGTAPDTATTFFNLSDPAFAGDDTVAFTGRLKPGTGTNATNAAGIWSDVSGTLRLVARQGAAAPGAGTATFASFISLGLPDAGGPVFIAKLKGATPATDVGIWAANAAGVVQPVLVREGDTLTVGAAQKTVALLQFLPPMKVVNGQTRSFNAAGSLTFRATFTDRSFAIFNIVGGVKTALAAKSGAVPGVPGATFAALGQPAIGDANDAALLGTMTVGPGNVAKTNDSAIFAHVSSAAPDLVAREGDPAPALTATFAIFSDPAANAAGDVAFHARLKPGTGGVTAANIAGIWTNSSGPLALAARQGFAAPGTGGVSFARFLSLALPDEGGAVFLAKLKRSRTVTAKNDTGIWAGDFAGGTGLVVRTGDLLTVGAGQRTIQLLQFLPPVVGVPGQTRSFNADGFLTFRAVFTDRSEAVFRVLR